MTTFQLGATLLLTSFLLVTLLLAARRRLAPRVAFFWCVLWMAAAVAIVRPQLTVSVAHALGISRGADLVFYLAILGMFIGFFTMYVRLRRIESDLTKVVRELAVTRPERHD